MDARDRTAGVLLHPTSLPGPYGIGCLGPEAHTFIDALQAAGVAIWQVLPLGPVAFGNSPYSSYSTFAGNPLLISLAALLAEGWLTEADLGATPSFPVNHVDFDAVSAWKLPVLRRCYERFLRESDAEHRVWLADFEKAHAAWLDDYALFMAIRISRNGEPWSAWPTGLVKREPDAMVEARDSLADEIAFHVFLQFLFDRQWSAVKTHAGQAGVRLFGDVPIFVALDSADVWTHQELFYLGADGKPTVQAGVPPDYFCATGQLWGNPLYDWPKHQATGYAWWKARLGAMFDRVDIVRIDHFRGLEAYWEVPADAKTAETGQWVKGPGADFLQALQEAFDGLSLVAEDLGVITPEVDALREGFGLPGMRVLQFAFTGEDPRTAVHIPHHHERAAVVFSGTHDNDTTVGWFNGEDLDADPRDADQREAERQNFLRYVGDGGEEIHWAMIRLCLASVADMAVIPAQDLLGLGSDARMNRPGLVVDNNWTWRLTTDQLRALASDELRDRLRTLIWQYGRLA